MPRPTWERLLKFRCTGCGNCCKGTYICITDEDARRLATGLGRPVESFVRFAREDETTLGKRHAWWVRFAQRRGVMVLRWRRGRCIFLDGDDRCTAYQHRPLVCRIHPFNVTLSGEDTGGVEKLSMNRVTECPHEWDGHQTKRDLGLLERLLWRESDRYIAKIERWNRRRPRRSPMAFLREIVTPEWGSQGGGRMPPVDHEHASGHERPGVGRE
jgi:Fe-S-cluster containining protein